MKSIISVLLISLFALGCTEKTNYLDKLAPPKESTEEKISDIEGLTFTPKVDILFVVDDSGSMQTHQNNLSRNMGLFIDELSKDQILDYHVGVITTDMDSARRAGRLAGVPLFVDRQTPGGLISLQNSVMVGTSGSATEQMFGPVIAALSFPLVTEWNIGFYRPDAHLAIVFITDAEDQTPFSTQYFTDFLTRLKNGDKSKILAYASYVPVGILGCDRDSMMDMPIKLEAALNEFSGTGYSLCDPDFGTKLAGLGKELSEKVGSFIPLARLPVVSTIKVSYGTQIIPNNPVTGWMYDPQRVGLKLGKEMAFDTTQPEGTELKVDFVPAEMFPDGYEK